FLLGDGIFIYARLFIAYDKEKEMNEKANDYFTNLYNSSLGKKDQDSGGENVTNSGNYGFN
ncbi:MAG: hypothetical protein LUH00_11665, partial [Lachnospiraceae bacterium]|nr:hypothetical protein [Lachnospiraceae bacterium]